MASAKKYDAIIIGAGQSGGTVDLGKVRQRKRDIFDMYCRGCRGHIEDSAWVDLLMGQTCFVDRKIGEVQLNEGGTKQLSADAIVIEQPVLSPGRLRADYLPLP